MSNAGQVSRRTGPSKQDTEERTYCERKAI